jgi:hypothetical protein
MPDVNTFQLEDYDEGSNPYFYDTSEDTKRIEMRLLNEIIKMITPQNIRNYEKLSTR